MVHSGGHCLHAPKQSDGKWNEKEKSKGSDKFICSFVFKEVPGSYTWHIYLHPIGLSLITKLQGRLGNVFILGGYFPAKDSISMKEKMGIGGQLAAADIIATPLDL